MSSTIPQSIPTAARARPETERRGGPRPVREVEVTRTEWLSPSLVRVHFTGDDLATLPELTFTDHYVKIIFPPAGADYGWPFDPETIKDGRPPEQWPVTRTYTIRSFDPDTLELAIDFVVHGSEGLAGPWAATARPGDRLGFRGPGGAYAPAEGPGLHLLVGDEAALPAIFAALEQMPPSASVLVVLEVEDAAHQVNVPPSPARDVQVEWVHRDGRPYGRPLAARVRELAPPVEGLQAFVHGNADMIKDVRRHLFTELGADRSRVSISGYWRTGHTEDRWQATKREFNSAMEAEEHRTEGA